jgi:hypothetical protein
MDALAGFLREATARRFEYGAHDCALFCADWVRLRKGVDPAAAWRGHYQTALGSARLIKRHGGLVALFDAYLSEAGAVRYASLRRGDVAIVESGGALVSGVVTDPCIACLGVERGVVIRHRDLVSFVAVWSI